MRLNLISIVALLALAACATKPDAAHIARMESYIGKHERELIYSWGTPDKTYEMDKKTKVLTYSKARERIIRDSGASFSTCAGGASSHFGYNNCFGGFPGGAETITYYCEYSFNVENSRVTGWFQNGNDCPRIK